MNGKRDLIEELAALAECTYVSDLHTPTGFPRIPKAVDAVERGRYSAAEWREAYCYITGRRLPQRGDGEPGEEEIREIFKNKA